MRSVIHPLAVLLTLSPFAPVAGALDLDVTAQDVERALAIARSTAAERARFHAPYVNAMNTPFVQSVEVVSEFRRVVLLAEERGRKGDRMFGYSVTLAQQAVAGWKRRVSVIARLRFDPLNTYVDVPPVDIVFIGREGVRIGVLKEPILSLPSAQPGDRLPVLGALVEGVFDAVAIGGGAREFSIRLEGRDLATVKFDFAALQ